MAVCRTVFIIESVSVKVSAKTQRKFAILLISDGTESYELAVWADLYEKMHFLLEETQLIYAVLQVDQQHGDIKLQCRWLSDLTKVDEEVLEECDAMYDKAKGQLKIAELKEKRGPKSPLSKESKKVTKKEPEIQAVQVLIDVDKAQMSHVLLVKKIFRDSAGDTPVTIDFTSGSQKVGSLAIQSEWGVEWSRTLEDLLIGVESVTSVVKK